MGAGSAAGEPEETIKAGVFLEGMDLSHLTADQARQAANMLVEQVGGTLVTVNFADIQVYTSLSDLGLYWSNPGVIDEIMQLGLYGNIVERYKNEKDLEYYRKEYEMTYALDPTAVYNYVEALGKQYNSEPEEAEIYTTDYLTPAVRGGTDGLRIRTEEASWILLHCISDWDGFSAVTVELPTDVVKPELSAEDMEKLTDVLGSATTYYGGSDYGRVVNVENGCSLITGTLLHPGEVYSVAEALEPFTAENGYELAGAFEENQVVQAYGGGICQVSTTLYNALLKAELEILDRSNHTMAIGYVDLAKDAAIAEGLMDLVFQNSLEDPIYIIGYCDGANITFTIYGHETRPANRTLELVSVTTEVIEPSGTQLIADTQQAVGYVSETQSPHTGYTAELWKYIYYDGELTDTVHINTSYYNAVGTVYEIGVASFYPYLSQLMYQAIAMQDLNQVYAIINSSSAFLGVTGDAYGAAGGYGTYDYGTAYGYGTQPATNAGAYGYGYTGY